MVASEKSLKKEAYFKKLVHLVQTYPRVLVVHADHVGSKQMSDIRLALRGKAVILMGKNTMIRKALRQKVEEMPELEKLIQCVKLNIGFVFCIDDPADIRKVILEKKVPAPARQGVFAPIDVFVPAGPTSMDPSQTSFFQALGISTKIVKGQIEIQSQVHLIVKGDKVTASQSVLLQKLDIRPFAYGLELRQVYEEGSVYNADVLDITDEDILKKFQTGSQNVAALSRQIGLPTEASISHSIIEAFKFCTSLVVETDYTFPQMEQIKKYLDSA
eukprot:GHVQ01015826.1.p2 GENE.GHVQ01015826.1~~GHVQ01015826.1.p2  ORF type:complete len:273 (+),score=37.89 GHVQ01015826.1:387-1205(+)